MKSKVSSSNVQADAQEKDSLSFEVSNSKPSQELLEVLEEGEKIVQEVRDGKRTGYNNVNEMMMAILKDNK